MSIIKDALDNAVDVPVVRPDYKGNAPQYITFHGLGDTGTIYAEGTQAETGSKWSVDIWSKGNFTKLLEDTKSALQQASFVVKILTEYFDTATGYYHVVCEASHVGAYYG